MFFHLHPMPMKNSPTHRADKWLPLKFHYPSEYQQYAPLYKHPEDFALYRVGTFDDSDGIVVAEQHKLLVLARDMVIKVQ